MNPFLMLFACTCAGGPGGPDQPGGQDTGKASDPRRTGPWAEIPGNGGPWTDDTSADEPSFWDLAPDTGWMAEYPVVDCPWPDEDDYVAELDVYGAAIDFYRSSSDPDHVVRFMLSLTALAETGGVCSDFLDMQKEWGNGSRDGINAYVFLLDIFQGPGTNEGFQYIDHPPVSVSIKDQTDGSWVSISEPSPEYYFEGKLPYQDFCLVRVRPHRVAGMVKMEAPPPLAAEYGWPEKYWNGLYLWWDWSWGEGGPYAEHQVPSCLNVLYENLRSPQEAWPDMPLGWSEEDTAR